MIDDLTQEGMTLTRMLLNAACRFPAMEYGNARPRASIHSTFWRDVESHTGWYVLAFGPDLCSRHKVLTLEQSSSK